MTTQLLAFVIPLAIIATFFFINGSKITKGNKSPVNWPIVGMLPSVLLNLRHSHDWLTSVLQQNGGTFVVRGPWFARMDRVITSVPTNVKYITSTNFGNYVKGSNFREILDVFGEGVFSSDPPSWTALRKLAHDLLHDQKFLRSISRVSHDKVEKGLIPLLAHVARQQRDGGGDDVVDLQDVLQRFTFDVMCLLIFGVDLGSLSTAFWTVPLAKAIDDAADVILFRHWVPPSWWKFLRWLRMGPEKKMAEAQEIIDDFFFKLLASRREQLKVDDFRLENTINGGEDDEPVGVDDLLTAYTVYQMGDETGRYKSDKFLRDSTLGLLFAGRDTTSASLAWFFWLVSTNPEVETKILEELTAVANNNNTNNAQQRIFNKHVVFDDEELNGCVYLKAALHEALRLFPPIPNNQKSALEQDVLPTGEKVRAGTMVLYSAYAMGRTEKIWGKDCLEFKPSRWISEQAGTFRDESSYKFNAFGSGPRICVGKSLSMAQMKVVVAAVIYNFQVRVVEGHLVAHRNSTMLHMKNGLMVSLTERFDT